MINKSFTLTDSSPSYSVPDMKSIEAAEFFLDWSGSATVEIKGKVIPGGTIEQTLATFSAPGVFRLDYPCLLAELTFERTSGTGIDITVEYAARARR